MRRLLLPLLAFVSLAAAGPARGADVDRKRDVIYGRKFGMALTMDVFTPKDANGVGLVAVISGGWFSSTDAINPVIFKTMLDRGYTVFAVCHGSQPKFTVPEIVEDMHRAVRFIRHHAKDHNIDADRLGIFGASAGGHLSLMQGMAGTAGDPKAKDPIDRQSSRVHAVAAFFPPTDFLNYGAKGKEMLRRSYQPPFTAAVDYTEFDSKRAVYEPVTDEDKQRGITRKVSPVYHVMAESPPTLLIHGDKDVLVPMQQSEVMVEKLKAVKVPVELVVRKGHAHGWPTILNDFDLFADWFDKHLRRK